MLRERPYQPKHRFLAAHDGILPPREARRGAEHSASPASRRITLSTQRRSSGSYARGTFYQALEPVRKIQHGSSEKAGKLMATLKFTLEEVACLGEEYVVNESGYEWSAKELMKWLERAFPEQLQLQVHFLRPTLGRDGAIFEVDQNQEVVGGVPLYWIQRHLAPMRADLRIQHIEAQTPPESGSLEADAAGEGRQEERSS